MVTVLIVILIICLVAVIAVAATRRTPASDDRVDDFRRHLDALSPDSRRPVIESSPNIPGIDDDATASNDVGGD